MFKGSMRLAYHYGSARSRSEVVVRRGREDSEAVYTISLKLAF